MCFIAIADSTTVIEGTCASIGSSTTGFSGKDPDVIGSVIMASVTVASAYCTSTCNSLDLGILGAIVGSADADPEVDSGISISACTGSETPLPSVYIGSGLSLLACIGSDGAGSNNPRSDVKVGYDTTVTMVGSETVALAITGR